MAENELNLDALLEEFNLPMTEPAPGQMPPIKEVSEEELKKEIEQQGTVEDIARKNIARLTRISNLLEQELVNGNVNAKMFEAASKLSDSLTSAAEILASQELTNMTFENRNRTLDLKEWELKERFRLKEEGKDNGNVTNLTANIIADRESLLDAIIKGIGNTGSKLSSTTVALETQDSEKEQS